jgi:hypothetical protein
MAYGQYTSCVAPSDYSGQFIGSALFWVALLAALFTIWIDPGTGLLALIGGGILYCRWWLYGRLVCLDGNRCMIGLALGVYNQSTQAGIGKFDTDYGVQILPAPSLMSDTLQDVIASNTLQGYLLADQRSATPPNPSQAQMLTMYSNYSDLGFTGEPESYEDLTGQAGVGSGQGVLTPSQASDLGFFPAPDQWQPNNFYLPGALVVDSNGCVQACTTFSSGLSGGSAPNWSETIGGLTTDNAIQWSCEGAPGAGTLEVEFEGAGVYDLYIALLAATPVMAAAAVACAIPFVGWIVCAILIAIALLIVGIGAAIGLSANTTPADADPAIGVIHPGQDVLFVMGRWIFDSGHQGWNELHPVLHCQNIGTVQKTDVVSGNPWVDPIYSDPAQLQKKLEGMCGLATEAGDPATKNNQTKPENGWIFHPLVDGCAPATVIQ